MYGGHFNVQAAKLQNMFSIHKIFTFFWPIKIKQQKTTNSANPANKQSTRKISAISGALPGQAIDTVASL
jgi:hypothetical protein